MARTKSPSKRPVKKQQQAPRKANTTDSQPRPDVQGWGADLDPSMRPAVPMERTPPRFLNVHWSEIEQQPVKIEVFHSVERPGITPVFGTSVPPKGVSGLIRRAAYKMTENDIRHWLLLLFADRVNMVEGIFEDLSRGHVPNIFAEMGLKSELKYNRSSFLSKIAVTAGIVGAASYFVLNRSRRQRTVAGQ